MSFTHKCICYSNKNTFDYIFILRIAGAIIATGTKEHEKPEEDQRDTIRGRDSRKMALLIEFYYG